MARVNFVIENENVGVYRLEDGTTLRVRHVLTKAEFKGVNTQNRQPVYELGFQTITDVEPGPNLIDTTGTNKG